MFSIHRVSVHAMYYKIACDQANRYQSLDTELNNLLVQGVSEDELSVIQNRTQQCYEEREQAAVITITFAAMSLEAFLYDYAAEKLGDNYVKKHLDKLDPKSKFVIYPRLVCGKEPDKSGQAYGSFSSLINDRNDLVHFKSKPFNLGDLYKASEFHDDLNDKLKNGVRNAILCVLLVMDELDRIHGDSSFRQRIQWSK